jgi:acyl dehydratase
VTPPPLLTDEVRAMVGRTAEYTAPEPLGAASIRYYALAMGSDPSRWRDEAFPTLVCDTNQTTGLTEPDRAGFIGHTWDLPLPVRCVMIRGGNDYRFHAPVRPDTVVSTRWELTDVQERADRAGTAMLVVTATATYTDQDGGLLATNVETLLFRPVADATAGGAG